MGFAAIPFMDPSSKGACRADLSGKTQQTVTTQHEKTRRGWRRIVVNFTPSWFSFNMGTGIVSILLHNLPYNAAWLRWIAVGIFALNVLLFVVFCAISFLRYTLFRGIWMVMLAHPVQSLFLGQSTPNCETKFGLPRNCRHYSWLNPFWFLLGTFPMGLATIINMIVFVLVPAWGTGAVTLAWVLWWIDAVLAVATNFLLPFIIIYKHEVSKHKPNLAD